MSNFDAQISLENAARLRYFERTGKIAPLLPGGITDAAALASLCEHCGQREGKSYHVAYTARPIHLCDACAVQDRHAAEALDALWGATVRSRAVRVLPSESRPPRTSPRRIA